MLFNEMNLIYQTMHMTVYQTMQMKNVKGDLNIAFNIKHTTKFNIKQNTKFTTSDSTKS